MYIINGKLYAIGIPIEHDNIFAYDYDEFNNCIYYTDDGKIYYVGRDSDAFKSIQVIGGFNIYLLVFCYAIIFRDRIEIYSFEGELESTIPVVIKRDFVLFKDSVPDDLFCYVNDNALWNNKGNKMCDIPEYDYIMYAYIIGPTRYVLSYVYDDDLYTDHGNTIDIDTIKPLFDQDCLLVYMIQEDYVVFCNKDTKCVCGTISPYSDISEPNWFTTNGYQWIVIRDNRTYYCHNEAYYVIPTGAEIFRAGHHQITVPTKSARFVLE